MEDTTIKRGQFVVFTDGMASDHSTTALAEALQDIDPMELRKEFLHSRPKVTNEFTKTPHYDLSGYDFIAWLENEKKLIRTIEHREICVEGYPNFAMAILDSDGGVVDSIES